jgi:hypothetical protein
MSGLFHSRGLSAVFEDGLLESLSEILQLFRSVEDELQRILSSSGGSTITVLCTCEPGTGDPRQVFYHSLSAFGCDVTKDIVC